MPVIVARRGSNCSACRLPIMIGERIHFTRLTKGRHLACADDRDDPEEPIRAAYRVHRAMPHQMDDARAFEECVREFGRIAATKALYVLSPIAKQREDEYQSKRRSAHT